MLFVFLGPFLVVAKASVISNSGAALPGVHHFE
jgi:hypothetical protein